MIFFTSVTSALLSETIFNVGVPMTKTGEVIHVSTFGHSVFIDSDSFILLALPQIGCPEKNKIRFRDKK
jgi:hypothetical protein